MNTRWNTFDGNIKVFHTKEELDKAFSLLKKIIDLGADVNERNINSNKSFKEAANNSVISKCLTFDIK